MKHRWSFSGRVPKFKKKGVLAVAAASAMLATTMLTIAPSNAVAEDPRVRQHTGWYSEEADAFDCPRSLPYVFHVKEKPESGPYQPCARFVQHLITEALKVQEKDVPDFGDEADEAQPYYGPKTADALHDLLASPEKFPVVGPFTWSYMLREKGKETKSFKLNGKPDPSFVDLNTKIQSADKADERAKKGQVNRFEYASWFTTYFVMNENKFDDCQASLPKVTKEFTKESPCNVAVLNELLTSFEYYAKAIENVTGKEITKLEADDLPQDFVDEVHIEAVEKLLKQYNIKDLVEVLTKTAKELKALKTKVETTKDFDLQYEPVMQKAVIAYKVLHLSALQNTTIGKELVKVIDEENKPLVEKGPEVTFTSDHNGCKKATLAECSGLKKALFHFSPSGAADAGVGYFTWASLLADNPRVGINGEWQNGHADSYNPRS